MNYKHIIFGLMVGFVLTLLGVFLNYIGGAGLGAVILGSGIIVIACSSLVFFQPRTKPRPMCVLVVDKNRRMYGIPSHAKD